MEELGLNENYYVESENMRVLKISGKNIPKISKVLKSPTRQQILSILRREPMDVSRLAKKLKQTEANISAQIKKLEEVGLIKSQYEPGGHGIRKICSVVVDKIIITLD